MLNESFHMIDIHKIERSILYKTPFFFTWVGSFWKKEHDRQKRIVGISSWTTSTGDKSKYHDCFSWDHFHRGTGTNYTQLQTPTSQWRHTTKKVDFFTFFSSSQKHSQVWFAFIFIALEVKTGLHIADRRVPLVAISVSQLQQTR